MLATAEGWVTGTEPMDEIVVGLGARAYSVLVGRGVLDEMGPRLATLGFRGRAGVVTDERVGRLYAEPVLASLRKAGFDPGLVEIPDGEAHKTLAQAAAVQDRLLALGVERRSPIVALGGGVVGDLAGFAAATLLRGLPTAIVPTTLLAQVDAAIGGKTGVNHPRGKNLIGAFHQPRLVLADVGVLGTLARRELVAGLAEVVKYGVIGDAGLFRDLEEHLDDILALEPDVLVRVVATCVRQKAAVVVADEREERGARAVLNFGHTVGHALEVLTGYGTLLHGEAVAIGMVAAARVSSARGRCGPEVVERIARLLGRIGLPTELPAGCTREALAGAMTSDKKSRDRRIRFVGVRDIGRSEFIELSAGEIASHL